MKKRILLTLIFLFSFIFVLPEPAQAIGSCSGSGGYSEFSISGFEAPYGGDFEEDFDLVPPPLRVTFGGLAPNNDYRVACVRTTGIDNVVDDSVKTFATNSAGEGTWILDTNDCWYKDGSFKIKLRDISTDVACWALSYNVVKEDAGLSCVEKEVALDETGQEGCFQPGDEIDWRFKISQIDGTPYQGEVLVYTSGVIGGMIGASRVHTTNSSGVVTGTDTVISGENATEYVGHRIIYSVYAGNGVRSDKEIVNCEYRTNPIRPNCTEDDRETGVDEDEPFEICNQIPEDGPRDKCLDCFDQSGVWTAIGCIDTRSTEGIVGKLMTVGIGIAGGIALLMILAAAFLFATSEGEPKRTSEAKEILTSALIGLIFIIFSVTVLQFIGVNILKIPGFGE